VLSLAPVPSARAATELTRLPAYRPAEHEPAQSADDRAFDAMIDDWFAAELVTRPSWATGIGIHTHDAELEGTSRVKIQGRLARVRQFLKRADAIDPDHLTPWRRLDRSIFVAQLHGIELEVGVVRPWQREPAYYPGVLSRGVFTLIKRDFAPADERLRSVNARLAEAPRVFRDARANLDNPPEIFTWLAIRQAQGLVAFLRDVVPAGLAGATDPAQRSLFEQRQKAAIAETERYVAWLQSDLLPRSQGDFRIGRDTYQKMLLYEEGVDTPVDTLLARGYAALADNHRRMVETARRIDPAKSPQQVLADMARDHPAADQLLDVTRAGLDHIRQFIVDRHICTPPPDQNLMVAETPLFNRQTSFASMDSPGVYERNANEAYFNVTLPDTDWTDAQKDEHLGFYNKWQLEIVSIHEAFPGHYYQFLHLKHVPSLVRQLMGSGSNSEGWAHYCEEMAIEQGFGGGDPRYELAMLNLALQRIGRYIAGIEMHVHGWDVERATRLFEDECYMARVNAEREARRGTSDPTYLVYTLGKWEIQRLRADAQRAWGDRFVLGDFHDRFLELGRAPLSAIREAMLELPRDDTRLGSQDAATGPDSGKGRLAGSDIAR
jgi:uncharacterized protein (DUF885 family)